MFFGSKVKTKGVVIGEGSVVVSGAVMTKSIPSHIVFGGSKVKVIRAQN